MGEVDLGPNVELADSIAGVLGDLRLWDMDLTCDAATRPATWPEIRNQK